MKAIFAIMFSILSSAYANAGWGSAYNNSTYNNSNSTYNSNNTNYYANRYYNYNDEYNKSLSYDRAYRLYSMGNLEEALPIFSSLCEDNNYISCLSAGIVQGKMIEELDNKKLSRSQKKRLKEEYYEQMMSFYTKACNGRNYDACNNLAFYQQLAKSDSTSKKTEETTQSETTERAIELYAKACKAGNKDACQNLGSLYSANLESEKTQTTNTNTKVIQAQNYYGRSCSMGDNVACFNLGVLRYNYAQTAADYAQSIQFFNQACNGDYPAACLNLGIIYERGVTNDADGDIANAMQFYTKACYLNNADACSYLSKLASKRSKSK